MADKIKVAELLVELGLDSKDAEKAAAEVEKQFGKAEDAAEGLSDSTDKSSESLEKWGKAAKTAGKVADDLTVFLLGAGTALATVGKAVIDTGAEFETLEARLKTATGSAEAARDAFNFIRDFASNTPFQVEELTDSFVKLRSFGLDPNQRSLTAFGDIAAGTSKSLDQLTEAVIDATSGEFERLKEFGIRSKQVGDDVEFTFRGVTTTVGKNAREIEEFLIQLGENNFAGAMAERMDTLDGLISNVKDSISAFFLEVAMDGPLEEFKGLIADIRDAAGDKDGLAKTLSRTLVSAIRTLRRVFTGDFIGILEKAAKVLEFVVENWEIFIGIIGGAKTLQAFTAAANGLSAMGVAASSALGPIGAIAGALIALIPIANKAGRAIGDAINKRTQLREGRATQRGARRVLGDFTPEQQSQLKAKDAQIRAINEKLKSGSGVGGAISVSSPAGKRLTAERARLQAERDALSSRFGSEIEQRQAAERSAAAAQARQDAQDAAEVAAEEAEFQRLSEEGGLFGPEFVPTAFKEPRSRARGRKKKKVTSPTTVSEFFRAASLGELGPIAARTPSTQEIEPTVAIDITNNNVTVENKFDIDGAMDPVDLSKMVAEKVNSSIQQTFSSAGQRLAQNVVR